MPLPWPPITQVDELGSRAGSAGLAISPGDDPAELITTAEGFVRVAGGHPEFISGGNREWSRNYGQNTLLRAMANAIEGTRPGATIRMAWEPRLQGAGVQSALERSGLEALGLKGLVEELWLESYSAPREGPPQEELPTDWE